MSIRCFEGLFRFRNKMTNCVRAADTRGTMLGRGARSYDFVCRRRSQVIGATGQGTFLSKHASAALFGGPAGAAGDRAATVFRPADGRAAGDGRIAHPIQET